MRRRWRAEPVSLASSLARARWPRASARSPVACRAAARSLRRPASARVKHYGRVDEPGAGSGAEAGETLKIV